ncbi:Stk1 family PASTA domain-containing Ser/Thr kinase [Bacillus salitolerans]|uniref:non-specific serine/threonine protein kinase n=1 Tax=Bacillus salitolerans TaxID=1437434 RepID=A0ABW4LKV1_9BACI
MIGKRLNGRYKIMDTIGGGGMANVYLARDMILERNVAVKVLRPDFSDDEEFIRRFHREAQAATSLNHPNVVSIYDVGEEDQIYYIVMEYIDGTTLKQYIQKYGPLSNEEAVNIMIQLTSALEHAHENHIVHRDIKPHNILIDENGIVKVTDFGIAVALSSTTITQTNSFLGSVHYLSPEQARGGMATKKSDIYSLGIVLFELITGRLPFFGESAVSIALKHLQSDTPSPKRWNPSIPQSLENIILKATAKDPFHRYDTVEAMEEDIRTSLNPDRLNERPFKVPQLDGEVTKAIPIITYDKKIEESENTIVHSEYKKDPAKKNKKGKKIALWIISIFFMLALAGVASLTIIPSLFLPKDVIVPDVSNKEYETAFKELSSLDFKIGDTIEIFDQNIAEGYVIRTDPSAGEVVKEGNLITIYKSKGKEKEEVENYIGQNFEDVKMKISNKFGVVTDNYIPSSDKPAGEILEQSPKSGSFVLEDTEITFWISKGPQPFTFTDLRGYTMSLVNNYVLEKKLKLLNVDEQHSDEYEKGTIISQKPAPHTELKAGDEISVVVSLGPEEKPKTVNKDILVKYEPSEEGMPQSVQIYIEDLDHEMTGEPVVIEAIVEDKLFSIQLNIPYKKSASYKVVRDGTVILEETVMYDQD